MHAKQNSAAVNMVNSVLFISVQTFLIVKMILLLKSPGIVLRATPPRWGVLLDRMVLCYNKNQ